MTSEELMLQRVCALAVENGRMRFLIGEAITYMSEAERFLESREKFSSESSRKWGDLIDRLREVIETSGEAK